MAAHSRTATWKSHGRRKPGKLQSMGSRGLRLSNFTFEPLSCIGKENGNLQGFLPGDLGDRKVSRLPSGVAQSYCTTETTSLPTAWLFCICFPLSTVSQEQESG